MNITGVIAEYNPFHKGHEYQLSKARQFSGCDGLVVVMSGNYVQRGEPAIIDKYNRAKAAIYGGADMVIELPMPYSCQNAEIFALGAMNELKKLHINNLSFGCEYDDIKMLKKISEIQLNCKYNEFLKKEIKKGISYPKAAANAIKNIVGDDVENIIKYPNNILAVEYIKSSIKLNLNCNYIPIKRIGSHYNSSTITGNMDSATAIRKNIFKNNKKYLNSLTEKSIESLNKFHNEHLKFNCLENYLDLIYYKSLCLGPEGLKKIYDVSEGLNNKIYGSIYKYDSLNDFIFSLKSKRFTYSRLRRILLNILLDINKDYITDIMSTNNDNIIKLLAFNNVGRKIIKAAKSNGVKIVNCYSDYRKYNIETKNNQIFKLTDRATNIYYLPMYNRKINNEYTLNAIYVDK